VEKPNNERRTTMLYVKPQLPNVKKASSTIMGNKEIGSHDSENQDKTSSVTAYRSDEQ
jgi:hypothetical protein